MLDSCRLKSYALRPTSDSIPFLIERMISMGTSFLHLTICVVISLPNTHALCSIQKSHFLGLSRSLPKI